MSKITYEDKTNVIEVLNRPTQATAEDFNEIKKSVNKLYDLLGAGGTIDLFEGDPIDGSWRIVGDYNSDTIKFQRWSEDVSDFTTVYQAGQSIESDAFVLSSISGQIKYKTIEDGIEKTKTLIRPSVVTPDSTVLGQGRGYVGFYTPKTIQAENIVYDQSISTVKSISGTSEETTLLLSKDEVFEWGISSTPLNMYVKSIDFDVITPSAKVRHWLEDEHGNVVYETCSERDYETGNCATLAIGVNRILVLNPVTIIAGDLVNGKMKVSKDTVFQAGHFELTSKKTPASILNYDRFDIAKIMALWR